MGAQRVPKLGSPKSKARLQRFAELQSQEFQKRSETNEIYIPAGERLGDKVIEFNGVSKGFGDRVLIDDLSFIMPPGSIVGVIGGNGAGKSTLLRMIMGTEQPDSGSIDVGETVQVAWVDQSQGKILMEIKPFLKWFPMGRTLSVLVIMKCLHAAIVAGLILKAPISKNLLKIFLAVNAVACTLLSH